MTRLTFAARNLLAQDPDLTALLGRSQHWDTWIVETNPMGILVENSQKALIVVNETGTWQGQDNGIQVRSPLLQIDVWADPTRNSDNSVHQYDAADKIDAILPLLNRNLCPGSSDVPPGAPTFVGTPGSFRFWGTADQIANKTGVAVLTSDLRPVPTYSEIADVQGGYMGRFTYALTAYY